MGVFHFFLKYLLMVFAQPHNTLTVQSTGDVLKPLPKVSLVLTPWSFGSCLPASLLLASLQGAGGILEVMPWAAVVLLPSRQGELVAGLAPCPQGHQIAPLAAGAPARPAAMGQGRGWTIAGLETEVQVLRRGVWKEIECLEKKQKNVWMMCPCIF